MLGVRPSFATGFAQWPGISEYPQLWDKSLVGAWCPFMGATGDTLADLSGNNDNGTIVGNPVWEGCKFGSGLTFDGTDDRVTLSTRRFANKTIVVWFKTDTDFDDHAAIFGKREEGWLRIESTEVISIYARDAEGFKAASSTTTYSDGIWHQAVGIVEEGVALMLYIDGQYINQTALVGATVENANGWAIGAQHSTSDTNLFVGSIDHCLFYNRALSAFEIALLYNLHRRMAA